MQILLKQIRSAICWCSVVMAWIASVRPGQPPQRGRRVDDRGSIGEWVMILVMAVGIVLFIWSIAQPMLGQILRTALSKLFR